MNLPATADGALARRIAERWTYEGGQLDQVLRDYLADHGYTDWSFDAYEDLFEAVLTTAYNVESVERLEA